MKLIKVAVACVNQTPFAWETNFAHLRMAIEHARAEGATLLCLPELAITGYGCEDAFFMDGLQDTAFAQLEALAPLTQGHGRRGRAARLSREGAVQRGRAARRRQDRRLRREAVPRRRRHPLRAALVQAVAGRRGRRARAHRRRRQRSAAIRSATSCSTSATSAIGFEICEDAWVANRPGTDLALRGVDIMCNPSASHFAFGKFAVRQRFVIEGSRAFGVAYLYANLLGNEAGRVVYDGGGLIASGGELLARGRRFSFHDVELATAVDRHRRQSPRASAPRQPSPAPRCRAAGRRASVRVAGAQARAPRADASAAGRIAHSLERGGVRARRRARPVGLPAQEPRAGLRRLAVGRRGLGGVRGARRARGPARVRRSSAPAACANICRGAAGCIDVLDKGGGATAAVGALLSCAYQPTENSGPVTRNAAETGREGGRRRVPRHRRRRAAQGVHRDDREGARPHADVGERRHHAAEHPGARARAVDLDAREPARRGAARRRRTAPRPRSATRRWTATPPAGSRRSAASTSRSCARGCAGWRRKGPSASSRCRRSASSTRSSRPPSCGRPAGGSRADRRGRPHAVRLPRGRRGLGDPRQAHAGRGAAGAVAALSRQHRRRSSRRGSSGSSACGARTSGSASASRRAFTSTIATSIRDRGAGSRSCRAASSASSPRCARTSRWARRARADERSRTSIARPRSPSTASCSASTRTTSRCC